ncbi:hypothetical protein OQA88_11133 [Cercophora sp. LCS_1]
MAPPRSPREAAFWRLLDFSNTNSLPASPAECAPINKDVPGPLRPPPITEIRRRPTTRTLTRASIWESTDLFMEAGQAVSKTYALPGMAWTAAEASSPALKKCSAATKDEPMPDKMFVMMLRSPTYTDRGASLSDAELYGLRSRAAKALGRVTNMATSSRPSAQGRVTQLEGGKDAGSGGRVGDGRASWTKTWHKIRELGLKTPTGACAVGGYRHTGLEHLVYSAVSILGKGLERQRRQRNFEDEADLLRSPDDGGKRQVPILIVLPLEIRM